MSSNLSLVFRNSWPNLPRVFSHVLLLFVAVLVSSGVPHRASAADFYVDSLAGSDNNSGISPTYPWKTIAKVNQTYLGPGDNVYFKSGSVWGETLVVPCSGSAAAPITFSAYGAGKHPLIKTSDTFSNWTLYAQNGTVRVWAGSVSGIMNYNGLSTSGVRVPVYYGYPVAGSPWSSPGSVLSMQNGTFYNPINYNRFYFRFDAGNPGACEIGTRPYGIYVHEKQHIVIDGIDVSGPRGSDTGPWITYMRALIVVNGSDDVTVRNLTLSNSDSEGAFVANGSTNCTYQNVQSYGHAGTGLYFWQAGSGNSAWQCNVYNIGGVASDAGDMGGIGVYETAGIRVDQCSVSNTGHTGESTQDGAISLVDSPNGWVNRCAVTNAGGTGIQIAENSDYGVASYNVINRWGVYHPTGHDEGIRIGGGASGSTVRGCAVYNNLIMNGGSTPGQWAALRTTYHDNTGLQVRNNIFYDNVGVYDLYAESLVGFSGWVLSNNDHYRTSGNAVYWNDAVTYDYAHLIGNTGGYFSFDRKQEKSSLPTDPMLNSTFTGLTAGSPCIGAGVNAGSSLSLNGNSLPSTGPVNIGPF